MFKLCLSCFLCTTWSMSCPLFSKCLSSRLFIFSTVLIFVVIGQFLSFYLPASKEALPETGSDFKASFDSLTRHGETEQHPFLGQTLLTVCRLQTFQWLIQNVKTGCWSSLDYICVLCVGPQLSVGKGGQVNDGEHVLQKCVYSCLV